MRGYLTQSTFATTMPHAIMVAVFLFGIHLTFTGAQADGLAIWSQTDSDSRQVIDHQEWDQFLKTYVRLGDDGISRVAYGNVSEDDRRALTAYIEMLEEVNVPAFNRAEQFAFWANLYNAVTVNVILEHYPVKSIKDIKPTLFSFGPWKKERVTVMGQALSLDDIEHAILRKAWQDPRVHYALNCASLGCPNLRQDAFQGDRLDDQLDDAARLFVNHPRGAALTNGALQVASIYKWFQEDFGGTDQGVIAHLKIYAAPDFASQLNNVTTIDSDSYDWSLNDASGDTSS